MAGSGSGSGSGAVVYPDLGNALRALEESSTHNQSKATNPQPDHRATRRLSGEALMASRLAMAMKAYLNDGEDSVSIPVTVAQFDRLLPSQQSILHPPQPTCPSGTKKDLLGLLRHEEERLMGPFIDQIRCLYPIIFMTEFWIWFDSLWPKWSTVAFRKPCALTDAILALGAHHSIGEFAVADEASAEFTHSYGVVTPSNAEGVARLAAQYHARSQQLVQEELKQPTLRTVQTCILLAVYLSHATLFSFAHRMVETAISAAKTIGLDHMLPARITTLEEELRSRIWGTLWFLDWKLSQSVGRDPIMPEVDGTELLPYCEFSMVPQIDGTLGFSQEDKLTWVSYQHRLQSLMTCSRKIQAAYNAMCAELLHTHDCKDVTDHPQVLEKLAECVHFRIMLGIDIWEQDLPKHLRIERHPETPLYSFPSMNTISLQTDTPPCQRFIIGQRVHLEIHMHHQLLMLRRPFVRAKPPSGKPIAPLTSAFSTRLADQQALLAVEHAIALTNVLLHAQRLTHEFTGWLPMLQMQWDAFIVLLSFLIGENRYDGHTFKYTRSGLLSALSCLEIFASSSSAARLMHNKARELVDIASEMVQMDLMQPADRDVRPPPQLTLTEPGQYVPPIITKELFDAAVEASNLPFASRSATPTPPPRSPPAPQSAAPTKHRVHRHVSHQLGEAPPLARPINMERSTTFGDQAQQLPIRQRTATPVTGYPPPVVPEGLLDSRYAPATAEDNRDPWMPMDAQGRVAPVRQQETAPTIPAVAPVPSESTDEHSSWPAAFPSNWSAGQSSIQRPAHQKGPPQTATQPGRPSSPPPRSVAMDRTSAALGRLSQVESRSTAGRHPRHLNQPTSSGPSALSVRGTGRTVPQASRTRTDYERLHGL